RPAIAALAATSVVLLIALAIGSTAAAVRIASGREELRRNLYASQVSDAFKSLEIANLNQARELLEAQRPSRGQPDLRGFEWRYLAGQFRTQEVHTFTQGGGYGCRVSRNGRYLACGSFSLHLYDLGTRQEIAQWRMPPESSNSDDYDFSPDDKILARTDVGG